MMDDTEAKVAAFFATQMVISIVKNMVASGAYQADIARLNVQETIEQGAMVLPPECVPYLTRMGHTVLRAIDGAG